MHLFVMTSGDETPNQAGAVDGGIPLLSVFGRARPAASDPHCWAEA